MGLDIQIAVDNHEDVFDSNFVSNFDENSKQISLSREFCNFMCRINVVDHKPELDQIGDITSVNIHPLYDMNQNALYNLDQNTALFKNNLDVVLQTIQNLKKKLETVEDINSLLIPTDCDTLNNSTYFSKFNEDLGDGYINNNFGQDIRNFERFLILAKSKGTKTVGFHYE